MPSVPPSGSAHGRPPVFCRQIHRGPLVRLFSLVDLEAMPSVQPSVRTVLQLNLSEYEPQRTAMIMTLCDPAECDVMGTLRAE